MVVDICKDVQLAAVREHTPPRKRHWEPVRFDPARADAILGALAVSGWRLEEMIES